MSIEAGRRRVAWIGKWIAAVGFFHSLGGFFMFFPDAWATIIKRGLIASVGQKELTETAFWFLITGIELVLLGLLVDWMERQKFIFPSWLKWGLAILVLVLIVPMPITGAWALIVPVGALFLRKTSAAEPPKG